MFSLQASYRETTFTRSLSLPSSPSLSAETTLTSTMLASVSERISISTTFDVLSSTNVASQSNSRTLSHRSQTISNMTRPFNSLSVSHNSPSHQATNSQSISYWNCSALAEISGVMSPLQEAAMTKFEGLVESFGVLQPATNHPTSLKFNNTVAVRMRVPSMRLDTVAMERLELLAALPLAMNFSISSPPSASRWLVAMGPTTLSWTSTTSDNKPQHSRPMMGPSLWEPQSLRMGDWGLLLTSRTAPSNSLRRCRAMAVR